MNLRYSGTFTAREALAVVLDKAHELPARGTHVGALASAGPIIPGAWDGNGPVPFGWSSFKAHRTDEFVWLPEPETASKLARLTPQERALLAQARAEAQEIITTPVVARVR